MNVKIVFDSVDIIDGIKDSFSVHVSMEEDVFSARVVNLEPSPEMFNGKADAIINTASGEIASFPDGADGVPMKSLGVSIQPIQSLNGYSSPWPAGGGKNLFNADAGANGYIDNSGAVVSRSYQFASDYIAVTAGSSYTISAASQMSNIGIAYFDSNKAIILPRADNAYRQTLTITPATGVAYVRFWINKDTSTDLNPTNVKETYKVQFEAGSSATSYAPYSNICPISGRTGLSVYRTGINVWDEQWEVGTLAWANGSNAVANDRIRSKNYIPCVPNTTYYFKAPKALNVFYYDASKTFIKYEPSAVANGTKTTPDNAYFIRFFMSPAYGTTYNHDISINYPSTDTDYHAYQGTTYAIDWTTQAGTVYGGTLDVVTGLLTVDIVYFTDKWKNGAGATSLGSYTRRSFTHAVKSKYPNYVKTPICNVANYKAKFTEDSLHFYVNSAATNNIIVFLPNDTDGETDIQVCYELATPLTYQLTAQEVETLKGQNHVWSDAGDVDLTYVADTKLYIDNKIAQAIAAALNA